MFNPKFRRANPQSRVPTYLQPYTLENLIAQVLVTIVLLAGLSGYDEYQLRKQEKREFENPHN